MIRPRRALGTWVGPLPPRAALAAFALLGVAAVGCGREAATDPGYRAEIEAHRAARVEGLQAEDGWLTLTGLFWLEEGENRFGSDPANPIVFAADGVPARAGTFIRQGAEVTLVAEPDSRITLEGRRLEEHRFDPAIPEGKEVLRLGRLRFHLIRRDGRPAIRLKDPESPARRQFRGIDFFPVDPTFRVEARLRPYDEAEKRIVPTVAGTQAAFIAPGRLEFELRGRTRSLEGLLGKPDDDQFFLVFQDETSGGETYGAGRYLSAPRNGDRAILDFNKAYNPPCAFTPFATCPLPPPGNRLTLPIEAGERLYAHP